MSALLETLKALGPARLGAMGVVAAMMMGFFVFIMMRVSQPNMVHLYNELTFEDTTAIIKQLESLNVSYQTRDDGASILVPKSEVLNVRMRLAEQGLPSGGSLGYELFDKADALGSTSFVQNINKVRALEGELSRTIRSLRRISAVRVHLVLPERELFRRDQKQPTASIVVRTRGALSGGEIRAIQHIVATAVQGLNPSRVTILDESGALLASGAQEDGNGLVTSTMHERAQSHEQRVRQQIEEIVSSVVGVGRTRVQVTAELDHNQISETSETFDPDGQVARSTQTREEKSQATKKDPNDGVTAGNQLPNADGDAGDASENENADATDEVVNYEISKTTRTEVRAAGAIKRISVAVLVDGVYATDAEGKVTYAPRSDDELQRIRTLVESAVGFDQKRGDKLEIVNLRFAEGPKSLSLDGQDAGLFDFDKDDIRSFIELGAFALISILMLLIVVRPLLRKIMAPEEQEMTGDGMIVAPDGTVLEDGQAIAANGEVFDVPESQQTKFDQAKAFGEQHAETIASVGKLVEDNPATASMVVRTWINEAA